MKNFKTMLLSTVFLVASSAMYAGDTKLGGIRAGWQLSKTYTDFETESQPLSTFYIGFYKNNKIAPTVNWTSGIEYFQTGWNDDRNILDEGQGQRTLHYISIPLALKLKVGPVFALAGSGFNFKVGETWEYEGENVFDLPGAEKAKAFDMPAFAGLGFSFLVFNIEARYHWGLFDINNQSDYGSMKNQYLQIGVGFEL